MIRMPKTSNAINGRADLSWFALRLAHLCYASHPDAVTGVIMPEDIIAIAQDTGQEERVVGVALKFLADLSERKWGFDTLLFPSVSQTLAYLRPSRPCAPINPQNWQGHDFQKSKGLNNIAAGT
jgi:hypothetical protein